MLTGNLSIHGNKAHKVVSQRNEANLEPIIQRNTADLLDELFIHFKVCGMVVVEENAALVAGSINLDDFPVACHSLDNLLCLAFVKKINIKSTVENIVLYCT